jgi:tRNA(fMet)-specific endonuclease VapC
MRQLLLDSDILSEILKGRDRQVEIHKDLYTAEFPRLSFTSATVLEILYGLERVSARAQIQRAEALFTKNDEVLPLREDYRLVSAIAGALDRQGTHIGLVDTLIAACAIRRGYGVASGNTNHFTYIKNAGYDFHLEDWRKAKS